MTTKELITEISKSIKKFSKENESVIIDIDIELKCVRGGAELVESSYVDEITLTIQ